MLPCRKVGGRCYALSYLEIGGGWRGTSRMIYLSRRFFYWRDWVVGGRVGSGGLMRARKAMGGGGSRRMIGLRLLLPHLILYLRPLRE